MNIAWLLGLLFLSQQEPLTDNLEINRNGQPISIVNRADFSMSFPVLPFIETERLDKVMDQVDKHVYKNPKNAVIDQYGNVITEQVGYGLNRQLFIEQVYSYFFNTGVSKIEVPIQAFYPKVDSELLAEIRNKKIGAYVTSFNAYNKERTINLNLAAEAVNNFVVFPGEIFSFNNVVGKRTPEKGYMSAPVIMKGKISEDIGGGICQVSSTLFNAADNAGLKIIRRFAHSKEVPYIPPGRDATVSWNGPDFVFENKYNQPILIKAKTIRNKLSIEIYSSDGINYTPKKVPYLPLEQKSLTK
jgi:vancomycin resistance protein YoaR